MDASIAMAGGEGVCVCGRCTEGKAGAPLILLSEKTELDSGALVAGSVRAGRGGGTKPVVTG